VTLAVAGGTAASRTAGPSHGSVSAKPVALPGWPITALLAFYPLWWALGLGVLIFPILAAPMLVLLLRRRAVGRALRLPPGFLWWMLFLAAAVISIAALGADPSGTVAEHGSDRLMPALYKLAMYVALTVLLIYAGNLTEVEMPRRRLIRLLAWLFVVTVAGGLLGAVAGGFQFTSPVEWLLPVGVRNKGFVQSLVHPYAAQIMDIVGGAKPRPAAPWGYTNTWGNNFCLLVCWLVVAAWPRGPVKRFLAVMCLGVSVVPAVLSLNRGSGSRCCWRT
jgi:hypothetical protein